MLLIQRDRHLIRLHPEAMDIFFGEPFVVVVESRGHDLRPRRYRRIEGAQQPQVSLAEREDTRRRNLLDLRLIQLEPQGGDTDPPRLRIERITIRMEQRRNARDPE